MNLTKEEIAEYKETFDKFDGDKSGSLDRAEITKVLGAVMKKPSPSEVEAIFKIADTDGNGTIEFDEFINAMQKIRTDQETEYRDIFNSFDIDGDGKINREELVLAFNKMGESLSPVEVDLLLEQFDTDGNGSICFNELCRMLKSLY